MCFIKLTYLLTYVIGRSHDKLGRTIQFAVHVEHSSSHRKMLGIAITGGCSSWSCLGLNVDRLLHLLATVFPDITVVLALSCAVIETLR